MLNIANIYSSAPCIKILVYFQLVFLISSPESRLSFWSSSSSQCYLHWWHQNKAYIKLRFYSTSLGQCLLRDSVVCQRHGFNTCSVRWSSYKPMFTFPRLSSWKSCNFISFDIYIYRYIYIYIYIYIYLFELEKVLHSCLSFVFCIIALLVF